MNPRLVGVHGPFKGTSFTLTEGEVSIGREASNAIWIADAALSIIANRQMDGYAYVPVP